MTDPASLPDRTASENAQQREPADSKAALAKQLSPELLAEFRAEFYSGLIPHPDILRGYNDLVPGSAKQILDTFNDQSHHRMRIEAKVVDSDIHRSWAGLASGLVIALAILWVARELVLANHSIEGTFLGTIDLASLVGIFVYVGRERRAEREEKAKVMDPARPADTERSADVGGEVRRLKS